MKLTATDQFGTPLPSLTQLFNENQDAFADLFEANAAVNGKVTCDVLDNPLAGLTCEEAATRLGCKAVTVRAMCLDGTLAAKRYPRRWRIEKLDLEQLAKARGGEAR